MGELRKEYLNWKANEKHDSRRNRRCKKDVKMAMGHMGVELDE